MKKYIFGVVVVSVIFFFKPIVSHLIENYASALLERKVKITSLSIIPLSANAYVSKTNNTIIANVISIYPLKVRAYYRGDIDAFKTYHPLKGYGEATADIYYDKLLLITAQASLYEADANVTIKEMQNNWFVGVDATSLNLKTLQEQNAQEVKANAVLDLSLKLYTDANISINLQTKTINILGTEFKDVAIKLLHEKDNFKLISSFKPPNFHKTSVDANATFKDGNISAYTKIGFRNENIILDNLNFNTKNLHTTLHTSSLGGELNITYKEDYLYLDAKNIHLSKVLKTTQQKIKARGYLNLEAKLDIKTLDADFLFSSPWLVYNKQRIEKVKLSVPNLKYKDNKLTASYKISAFFMKKLDLKEHNISVIADGSYNLKSKLLKSNFKASVPLKNNLLDMKGKVTYQNNLKLQVSSSSFESQTLLKLEDKNFNFYTRNLNLHALTAALNKPIVFFGYIDVEAKGNLNNMDFNINSEELRRNFKLGRVDNYLSLDIQGNYTPELLSIKNKLILNYKKEHIPLKLNLKIEPEAPYNSKGSLFHKEDKLVIHSFSYENEQVKSDFLFDVKELNLYRALMANKFRGPMRIEGTYKDALNIKTNSLGGEIRFVLDKQIASLYMKKVDITKVAKLIEQNGILSHGVIDGNATYNIKEKTAKTNIALRDAILTGINIDEKISSINDAMGLNIINLSKSVISNFSDTNSSYTKINHLQLNASLKDKKIKLDDVAFSTDKFLIVAIGDFEQNGDINSLDVSIVNKQGCAIITQALKGNIKDPQTAKTTSTIVNITQRIPTSILKTGRKILNIGTQAIDDVATFGVNKILKADTNISIISDIVSGSSSLIESTSDIIVPDIIMSKECRVIYDGKVTHPRNLSNNYIKENK
ncbi:hypothetical protein [Sulfurimonas sp.]|uniref:hypothetical protein n=1 Tax=Sulfurimonas sp. TaxID=2022749 RepID=UPI002B47D0A6|nr:hypothetical protein [Sulfurimonas sp.]